MSDDAPLTSSIPNPAGEPIFDPARVQVVVRELDQNAEKSAKWAMAGLAAIVLSIFGGLYFYIFGAIQIATLDEEQRAIAKAEGRKAAAAEATQNGRDILDTLLKRSQLWTFVTEVNEPPISAHASRMKKVIAQPNGALVLSADNQLASLKLDTNNPVFSTTDHSKDEALFSPSRDVVGFITTDNKFSTATVNQTQERQYRLALDQNVIHGPAAIAPNASRLALIDPTSVLIYSLDAEDLQPIRIPINFEKVVDDAMVALQVPIGFRDSYKGIILRYLKLQYSKTGRFLTLTTFSGVTVISVDTRDRIADRITAAKKSAIEALFIGNDDALAILTGPAPLTLEWSGLEQGNADKNSITLTPSDEKAASIGMCELKPKQLAVGFQNGDVIIADLEKKAQRHVSLPALNKAAKVLSIDCNSAKELLVIGTSDGFVYFLDAQGKLISSTQPFLGRGHLSGGAFNSSTQGTATYSDEDESISKSQSSNFGAKLLSFSNDGKMLYAIAADRTLKLLDVSTLRGIDGKSDISLTGLSAASALQETPDGKFLIIGFTDGTIKVFDQTARKFRDQTLEGHRGSVSKLIVGLPMENFASVSSDGTVRIWSLPAMRAFSQPLHVEGNIVFDVQYRPTAGNSSFDGSVFAIATAGVTRIAASALERRVSQWSSDLSRDTSNVAQAMTDFLGAATNIPPDALNSLLSEANRGRSIVLMADNLRKAEALNEHSNPNRSSRNDLWQFISVSVTRIGALLLILFLVQIFIGLYRYNTKLSTFFAARARALRLIVNAKDVGQVEAVSKLMTPDEIDFSKPAPTPIDQVAKLLEQVVPLIRKSTT